MTVEFRAVTFNIRANRFSGNWGKRREAVHRRLTHVLADGEESTASLYLLTECYADEAKYLARQLGLKYKRHLGCTLLYNKSWTVRNTWTRTWHGDTHGALIVELIRDDVVINVVVNHTPSAASGFTDKKKTDTLKNLFRIMSDWKDPTIVGGDMNMKGMTAVAKKYGFASVQPNPPKELKTMGLGGPKPGLAIDYLFHRKMDTRWLRMLTGWGSDHHLIAAGLRAPNASTL